jgi:hypothetical protein
VGVVACVTKIPRVRGILAKYDNKFREIKDALASKQKIITAFFSIVLLVGRLPSDMADIILAVPTLLRDF